MFWQNEEYATGLGSDIHLDGVVCVVDAVFGDQVRDYRPRLLLRRLSLYHSKCKKIIPKTASGRVYGTSLSPSSPPPLRSCQIRDSRQIACADVILINKVDLVSLDKLKTLEASIRQINPTAVIYRTVRGQIDLKHILGIGAYAIRVEAAAAGGRSVKAEHDHSHEGDDCDHDHSPTPTHYEIRGITSLQVTCPTLTDAGLQALDEWIRDVLWEGRLPGENPSEKHLTVLRCKGMIPTQSGQIYILQGVRSIYELAPTEPGSEEFGVPEHGKVVFIGKGLDENVRRSLEDMLVKHRA